MNIKSSIISKVMLIPVLVLLASMKAFSAPGVLVDVPLDVGRQDSPMTMFVMSNDHQLYFKAYSDYSDLNGDGNIDTSYNDDIEYGGYFASNQCYSDAAATSGAFTNTDATHAQRFRPVSLVNAGTHACTGAYWSGNFLNWATMSRIDVIRHVLYGGLRVVDTETLTVLARASIPRDNHTFVKIFQSVNMSSFTPYSDNVLSFCNVSHSPEAGNDEKPGKPTMRIARGSEPGQTGWPRWSATERTQCTWGDGAGLDDPDDTARLNSGGRPSYSAVAGLATDYVGELTIKVEVCSTNSSGFNSAINDGRCTLYEDTTAGTSNYKTTGLLQQFGENGDVRFGLMTGSYNNNKSGGVLRSQIKLVTGSGIGTDDEIDTNNGIFNHNKTTSTVSNGIIQTIDSFKIAGFGYNDNNIYQDCGFDRRTGFDNGQCMNWGNPVSEMYLEALRYLRGGLSPTTDFNANDSGLFPELTQINTWDDPYLNNECAKCNIVVISTGLSSFDTDELDGFTDVVDVGSGTDIIDAILDVVIPTAETIPASGDPSDAGFTSSIPFAGNYFLGQTAGVTDADPTWNVCTPKSITGLSNALGACPEEPALEGGFDIAAMAYYARTTDIRNNIDGDQIIDTYAISLAESLPTFELTNGTNLVNFVPVCQTNTNEGWKSCSLVDIVVLSSSPTGGAFTIYWEDSSFGADADSDVVLDFEYCIGVSCTPAIGSDEVRIEVGRQAQSTPFEMRFGYSITGVGDRSGSRIGLFKNGNNWQNLNDNPVEIDFDNTNTNNGDFWSASYTMVAAANNTSIARTLNNPLWYAAKYGGFNDSNNNNIIDSVNEWDSVDLDGIPGSDGIPDKYFPVRNPNQFASSLERVLTVSSRVNSSAAATFSSGRISDGTLLFLAEFDTIDWSGDIKAFTIDNDGIVDESSPVWSAKEALLNQVDNPNFTDTDRNLLSLNNDGDPLTSDGVVFSFPSGLQFSHLANATQFTAALNSTDISEKLTRELLENLPSSVVDDTSLQEYGSAIVNYIKGDSSNEVQLDGSGTNWFRSRINSNNEPHILGAIVRSSPFFMGAPNEPYPNTIESTDGTNNLYNEFNPSRTPVVFAGANDGMLHAFDARNVSLADGGGQELFAYIPSYLDNSLANLASPNYSYQAYVDGDVTVRDVFIDGSWASYLVGATRTGGRGIYILDVTTPDSMEAADVVGEFQHQDLGLTFSKPQIIKMNASAPGDPDRWAAVFGNGYNNTGDGRAKLFIVFLDDLENPVILNTFEGDNTQPCSAAVNNCNGLSTPTLADLNGDFVVDRIYAGDVQGNMWAFDVSSSDRSLWGVAYGTAGNPSPLFTACGGATCNATNRQPITTAPKIQSHPTRSSFSTNPNVLVYFGTGQFIASGDVDNSDLQSFYAVWDTGVDANANRDRSHLVEQIFERDSLTNLISIDSEFVPYSTSVANGFGWYIDVRTTNANIFERGRVVIDPLLIGEIVLFVISVPELSGTLTCVPGGDSFLVALDAYDGSEADFLVFDLSGDGTLDSSSPVKEVEGAGIVGTGTILDTDGGVNLSTTRLDGSYEQENIGVNTPINSGRTSWSIIK